LKIEKTKQRPHFWATLYMPRFPKYVTGPAFRYISVFSNYVGVVYLLVGCRMRTYLAKRRVQNYKLL